MTNYYSSSLGSLSLPCLIPVPNSCSSRVDRCARELGRQNIYVQRVRARIFKHLLLRSFSLFILPTSLLLYKSKGQYRKIVGSSTGITRDYGSFTNLVGVLCR